MDYIDSQVREYFKLLMGDENSILKNVREDGEKEKIPVVDREIGQFLSMTILSSKAKNILELGFGGGYSTLCMAKALSEDGQITSLELNTDRIARGKRIFEELNLKPKLNLLYTDVSAFLKESPHTYDFIFLDAIKKSYMDYFQYIPKVLKKGGIFVADNILFRGYVLQKEVEKKYEVGTSAIKAFNTALSESKDFETLFLPIGDGLSFSVKISD